MRGREENNKTGVSTKDQYKLKLEKLYFNEFEDGLLTIFQDTESVYINKILTRINLAIGEITPKIDEKLHLDTFKILDEKLTDKYYQTKKNLLKYYNEFKKSSNLKSSEFFFRKHCKKCPEIALHTCQNRLILIKENNEPKYAICSECKVVFLANSLILHCNPCNIEYYSSVVSNYGETEYQPATWENYHCGSFLNEQISCIKCKDFLFIRNSDNYLCCLKCRFASDARKLVWICTICKNEFQSNAKIFNQIEFKIIKNSIKEALLDKKAAKPLILPCCGSDLKGISRFKHKKQCQGELYFGELSGRSIVVCSKCKSVNNAEGFVWTCPKCDAKFKNDRKNSLNPVNATNLAKFATNMITPLKNKSTININNVDEKTDSTQFVRKNIVAKSTIIKEPLIERINHLKNKDVEIKNQDGHKRSNSVYQNINRNINIECNNNSKKNVSNFNVIKEEEIDKDGKNDENNSSDDEETDIKNIEIEKKTIIGILEKNEKTQNNLRANNSKNSNSSNNNNETADSINRNSNKSNAPIPIPNKTKNKIIHRNTINVEESSLDIEKEILGDQVNNQNLKKNRNLFLTPECQIKKSDSGLKNISVFNCEIREETSSLKKTNTPIPVSKDSYLNLSGKNSSNSDKNIVKMNVITTPKKTLFFGEKIEKQEINEENIPKITPLEIIKIDDYKIKQNIGEGSFGIIYLSENNKTKEKFAMKKIIVNNDTELNLFMSEFELVNKFPHKNILTIYGLCNKTLDFSTKVLYILMELAISDWDKEIKQRYKSNHYYKEHELILLLKQIVLALTYLQERGISHRDIKPQNILIFPSDTYKIADFGEAKEVKQANYQMETLRGTELYMSPILFTTLRNSEKNNVKHNSFKSDVFSLGYCMLYAATLSYKVLYDLRNCSNQKYVNNIIKTYISKKYSTKFVEFVSRMVDVNESNRFDFVELNKYLNVNF